MGLAVRPLAQATLPEMYSQSSFALGAGAIAASEFERMKEEGHWSEFGGLQLLMSVQNDFAVIGAGQNRMTLGWGT